MTTRSTTLVESDQLAQAAAAIIRNADFVPKGKRWRFSKGSRAHREYDRAVQDIALRRQEARENAVEKQIRKERANVDAVFDRAKGEAQAEHDSKLAETRKPYDEIETQARSERDAAIAAANLAYQQSMEAANRIFQQEAATIDQNRNTAVAAAKAAHDEAYAVLDDKRKADLAQIDKDLKTIRLEGPMRIVEDRKVWAPEARKKALIGIVDMAGREEVDAEYADLCLRNVMGYVFQDRYLKPDAQQHRLMDTDLLEALVDLARRCPDKRPTIVKYLHDIVEQNPGHSSPAFIKNLTELYVVASADTKTSYHEDPSENERMVETMRAHIADALKLTPRRSQVRLLDATQSGVTREPAPAELGDDQKTPVRMRMDAEITADVDIRDLFPVDAADAPEAEAEVVESAPGEASPAADGDGPPRPAGAPPPPRRRRRLVPEGST